ncbi:Flp family type IVb pilin [Qipengyuania sp.]|uniref:Flp family type IVb pilin n=1 Tax=Qipengyuania sp. TaxID=2004515 RepID=UPI0035C855A7
MFEFLARLGRDANGATAVEYGLILALVFLAMIGGVSTFGQNAISVWDSVSNKMTSAQA